MKRLLVVVGARPNYMKAAPILEAAERRGGLAVDLVHTGQHYDPELSSLLMNDLGMKEPEHKLEVGKGTQLGQIAAIISGLEAIVTKTRPDALVVVGDVSSTLAGALVANKSGITLVHVEAGLRSHDPAMPEEWNRRATDLFSDLLFCTERSGVESLLAEGKREDQVYLVGNGMIDTLLKLRPRAQAAQAGAKLGVERGRYALLTLHRPSNVDDPVRLGALLEGALLPIARELPLVFPVHPRTRGKLEAALAGKGSHGLVLTPPLGYIDFVSLMEGARLVVTDSGGIQEETTVLGVPCLTVRENTERPITIDSGTNKLVGTDPKAVLLAARAALAAPRPAPRVPPLWDGRAAERTVAILSAYLEGGSAASVLAARAAGARVGREGLAP
jgi:UDP-N-acetylglucosamine 2-epimerase (non-hydrolysing)